MTTELLVAQGGEIKGLGNDRVGGWLVVFSGAKDPDLTGDFFTKDTDFGPHKTTLAFYDHGYDAKMQRKVLDANATLEVKDAGVWVEAQLDARDEYQSQILKLAQAGKLGWSSGTAGHLVEREQVGKSFWIKSWPLGLDASITPTPAEPRTRCVPLKSLFEDMPPVGMSFDEHSASVRAAVKEFMLRAKGLKDLRAQDGRTLSAERYAELKTLRDEVDAIVTECEPRKKVDMSIDILRAEVALLALTAGG